MTAVNPDFRLRDLGVSNALQVSLLPRHRWYFIKEAFSPTLVNEAIAAEGVCEGELLLDPFAGGGTVPLTAAAAGFRSEAIEVNPFLRFLATTKLSSARPATLKIAGEKVLRATRRPLKSKLEGYSTFTKGNRWDRWLFPLPVIRAFEAGRRAIIDHDGPYNRLLKLALIGAAMDCCNASRDGKCLRYRPGWKRREARATDFEGRFRDRLEVIRGDLEAAPIRGDLGKVVQGDARALMRTSSTGTFRLCVTSPPYLNSFDYSDVYRPELFLGQFVRSSLMLRNLRARTVRSHVQSSWPAPERFDFGALYGECISRFEDRDTDLWDPRLPTMIQAYFEDMQTVLSGLLRRAQENSAIWLVVSTSAYGGVEIPVDLILAEIAQRVGWYLREVGVLRYLRSSSQHVSYVDDAQRKAVPLRESVVILHASP